MKDNLNYINPSEASFYSSEHGLLMLSLRGENMGRVTVLRMFPFRFEKEYLCVRCETYSRSDKENEIGIIRSLADFPESQAQLIQKELDKRYFVPEIIRVIDVKEEYGHTIWKTQTTAGEREFTVNDMASNVRNMGNNRIMLTDVNANRYYIPDITKADDKTMRIIEIWI